MARKPPYGAEALRALGPERLADLVFQKAEEDPAFKRRVKAALAGLSGPMAAAKVIEKRIISLGRAKGRVTWRTVKALRGDLSGMLAEITGPLAEQDPEIAAALLIRFLATSPAVMERIETSTGAVPELYKEAEAELGNLAGRLTPAARARLPGLLMEDLGGLAYGPFKGAAAAVLEHLPGPVAEEWGRVLARRMSEQLAAEAPQRAQGRWVMSPVEMWRDVRQMIAARLGDVDLVLALDAEKPEHLRNSLDHAVMLADAGRLEEALAMARRPVRGKPDFMTTLDMAYLDGLDDVRQVLVEADILTRMGEGEAAGALRWARFCDILSVRLLKAHLATLADFDDIEAEEAGFEHALRFADPMRALAFFLAWPRRDLAARLVITRRAEWDGAQWGILPGVAETLEAEYPLASVILVRALLENILIHARSQAYGPGAEYVKMLARLAPASDAQAQEAGIAVHESYMTHLRAVHGRKAGFWAVVDGKVSPAGSNYRRGGYRR